MARSIAIGSEYIDSEYYSSIDSCSVEPLANAEWLSMTERRSTDERQKDLKGVAANNQCSWLNSC